MVFSSNAVSEIIKWPYKKEVLIMETRHAGAKNGLWLALIMVWISLCFLQEACSTFGVSIDLKDRTLSNEAAYIPPQCYVKTDLKTGKVFNTCYTCHTRGQLPNIINDSDLQKEFLFPAYAMENRWKNVLRDRSALASNISDQEILDYIRQSNYFDEAGRLILADKLVRPPMGWDYDRDGRWDGFVPDCYFSFDESGFDRDPDGHITGWRAYSYYPFPSTYWPSGGNPNDIMIRLPEIFRTNEAGEEDLEVYAINLAILESLIKKANIRLTNPVDETLYQVDLNKDGSMGEAQVVVYDWAPLEGRNMSYVGQAKLALEKRQTRLAAGLFPRGTEYLSTVRYLDIRDNDIVLSERFKEVRYLRKVSWLNYAQIEQIVMDEIKEKDDFPDRLRLPVGNPETGVYNGSGWIIQAFIEDAQGELRPQNFEETTACIGCHGGVGVTTDSIFSFSRKLDAQAAQAGWAHWSQRDYLKGLNEPKVEFKRAGIQYEYTFYLMYGGAGDDFRANSDNLDTFFGVNGVLRQDMAEALHDDISLLLYPSPERLLALNKAYKTIVDEQSFIFGRDIIVGQSDQVHDVIDPEEETTGVNQPITLVKHARDFKTDPYPVAGETPSEDWIDVVDGTGMGGPSGEQYQIDWSGFISKSNYGLQQEGVYFRYPRRHTLPARMIVPLGQIPVCYQCHRMPTTVPDRNPQVTVPVALETAMNMESGIKLKRLTDDAGWDGNAQFSPDGSLILYESQAGGGDVQLWRMDPDGSNKKKITNGPKHAWARFRPDGQRLTYWQYHEDSGRHCIINSNVDGTDVIVVDESFEPLDRPDWSPDGRYIAYAALKKGNWDIWIAKADGSSKYRVTSDPRMETNPLWKPQGLALSYKMAPTTGKYNLTEQYFMTFENGFDNPTVYVWNGIQSIQMNDWSPDGSMVAYTAEIVTPASGEDRVSYAAVVEKINWDEGGVNNGTPVLLAGRTTLGDRGPVFSPDNQKVAFWAWDKNYRATLWVADVDGGNRIQLTSIGLDMAPQWSPDGTTLVFESTRSGNQDVWILQL
jgi:Tol biopolymer transport system component